MASENNANSKFLRLKPSGVTNVYRILKTLPKTKAEIEKLVTAIYTLMEDRERQALERTDEVLKLITSSACFSRLLAQHFGDDLDNQECGHCTWCTTHKPVELLEGPPVPFNTTAFNAILSKVSVRDDARLLAKIAFGISSPRITTLKMGKDPLFGSMEDHEFMVRIILQAFSLVSTASIIGG